MSELSLIEEILSPENLEEAYHKVCKNKGASGIDGITVACGWRCEDNYF